MKQKRGQKTVWWVFGATVAGCFLLLLVLSFLAPAGRVQEAAVASAEGAPVSVLTVEAREHKANVTALGEVVPVLESTIRAQVNGEVEFVSETLREGTLVEQGELLVRLESSAYQAQVANAVSGLAVAEAALLEEELLGEEARENWARSGMAGQPVSSLTLRAPQLKVARANVEAARTALVHARQQLAWTEIRAPYDGVVVARNVDMGESLFAGDLVGSVFGLDAVEIGVQLDNTQWDLLPRPWAGVSALLRDPQHPSGWPATVVRDSRRLYKSSRLRTLFLRVENPLEHKPPLLPGMFVRAEVSGREIPGLIRLPDAALTKSGRVWLVDAENCLKSHRVEPVFRGDGTVFIEALSGTSEPLRVAVSPNDSFTDGMRVRPMEKGEGS